MPSVSAVCASAAYSATQLAMGLVLASLGPVMLAFTAQTAASIEQLAVIFSARAIGHVGGCIVGGWLLDKLPGGGHRLMVASLLHRVARGQSRGEALVALLAARLLPSPLTVLSQV